MLTIAAAALLTLTPQAHNGQIPDGASVMDSGSWILRVGGESEAALMTREGPEGPLYNAGVCFTDTKLPVGYPSPTPPGAIELKHYASVRRAEHSSDSRRSNGFWPLFQHIQRNDIAMTAPVEMEQRDTNNDGDTDQWTMTFLYHTTDNGPTGTDGRIEIVDTEPETWLSIGIRGRLRNSDWSDAESQLDDWIESQEEWERVSEPRTLGYNGPNVPASRQWWELQVRVERIEQRGDDR